MVVGESAFNKTNAQIGDFVALNSDKRLGRVQNVYQNSDRPFTFDIAYEDGTTTLDVLPHLINWNPPLPQDQVKAATDPSHVDTFTAWQQDGARHETGYDWRCDGPKTAPTIGRRNIWDSTSTVRPPIHIVRPTPTQRRGRFSQPPPAPTPIGINQSVTPPSRTGRSFTSYVPPDWLRQHSLRKQLEVKISQKELEKQRLIDGLPEYLPGPSTPFPGKASTPYQPRRPTLDELRRQSAPTYSSEAGLTRAMSQTTKAIDHTASKLNRFEKMAAGSRREIVGLNSQMRKLQDMKGSLASNRYALTPGGSTNGYTPGKGIGDDDW